MRWVLVAILAYLAVLLQGTLGNMLSLKIAGGWIGPDLAAVAAVFLATRARLAADAMLAAWALGLATDLAGVGGVGASSVGPMAVAYALAARAVFAVRDAMFRDRPLTQAILTAMFCLLAHVQWLTYQALLNVGSMSWADYGGYLVQAVLVAAYSAILAPLLHVLLRRPGEWIILAPTSRWR